MKHLLVSALLAGVLTLGIVTPAAARDHPEEQLSTPTEKAAEPTEKPSSQRSQCARSYSMAESITGMGALGIMQRASKGTWYYFGHNNVRQDYAEAAKWFRKAAVNGEANSQFMLGMMYKYGQGVPQDDAEALTWLRRAAALCHDKAREWLEEHGE